MSDNKWLLQTKEGRIFGPHSTSRVLELITEGAVTGDELISEYPTERWTDISRVPQFYDRILDTLARSQPPLSQSEKERRLARGLRVEETIAAANAATPSKASPVEEAQFEEVTPEPKKNREPVPEVKPRAQKAPTIELKVRVLKTKPKLLYTLAGAFVLLVLFLLLGRQGSRSASGYVHLMSPNPGENTMSERDLKANLKKVAEAFQRDTFQDYALAQDQLVRLIEEAPRNSEALAFLCLTHRELWPYSYQDDLDLAAVSKTAQLIAQVDPVGFNGATCRAVQQMVNGHFDEALSIVDTVLQEFPSVAVLYEFKGDLLAQKKDFVTAVSYLQKTQQLWKGWLKPYVVEAEYRSKLGQFSEAATMYRQILKSNPQHSRAKVLLGIIEYKNFQHPQIAIDLLKTGLESDDKVDRATAAQGFATLGFIYEKQNDTREGLKYAKKAYLLKPIDENFRALVLRLGGEKALNDIKANDNELVAMGDLYFKDRNYLAAQAQYKSAYEVNTKNAIAALKAARTLWILNDSNEAIEWAQKAVRANPNFVEAYATLAEYYTDRYDFMAATSILQKVQRIVPESYEVYRGWAQLELKRNNFQGAVNHAKKALANYDTDLESHILLVKAYRGLENHREAYQWAARAIELDSGSPKAQSLYAEVLADFQGVEGGVQYIRKFVNTYPRITEFKITLAKILRKEERFTEALQVLTAATNEAPNNKEALLMTAECLQKIDKLEDARSYYLAAAALDPSDPEPLFELGELYLSFNKPDQAIEQFRRVQRLNPRFPRTHYDMGRAALLKNDGSAALKEAEEEKRLNPRLADAYLLSGDARMVLKQYAQAANEFQAALKLRPQGADIYVKLAVSYRLIGNPDTCLQMLKLAELQESGNAAIYKERGACFEMKNDASEAIDAYNRYLQILPNAPDKSAIEGRIQNMGGG